jgi:hypothetical protein
MASPSLSLSEDQYSYIFFRKNVFKIVKHDSKLASNYQTTQYLPRSATKPLHIARRPTPLRADSGLPPPALFSSRAGEEFDPPARPPHHAAPHSSPQRSTGFRANFSHYFAVSELSPFVQTGRSCRRVIAARGGCAPSRGEEFVSLLPVAACWDPPFTSPSQPFPRQLTHLFAVSNPFPPVQRADPPLNTTCATHLGSAIIRMHKYNLKEAASM